MKETGQILKEKRIEMGLTTQEVSLSIKVSPKILNAIEEDDKNKLPRETFLRGFVKAYAQYLKLDVEHVMSVYNKEQQLQKIENREEKEASPQEDPTSVQMKPIATKIVAVIAIVALVAIVAGIKSVVEKYEKEAKVASVPEEIKKLSLEEADQPKKEASKNLPANSDKTLINESEESNKEVATNSPTESEKSEAKNVAKATEEATKLETESESKIEPENKPPEENKITKKKPEPEKETKPEPTETKVSENEKNANEETEEEKEERQSPGSVAKKVNQELIIEALDSVKLRVSTNGSLIEEISLGPNQIHVVKGTKKFSLMVSDGGAINLIHNGRDKGVPGDLGQPTTLNFP